MTTNTSQIEPVADAAVNASPSAIEEIEKLRTEISELQSELRTRVAGDAFIQRLKAAAARSPELMLAAVREKLQLAADGTIQNAEAIIDLLRREMPEQFSQAPSSGSIDGGAGFPSGQRPLTKESLAAMSPEQISLLDWTAVRQVLSQR